MSKSTSYVLKLLAKKDYTEQEIRRKLTLRQFTAQEIEEAISFLKTHSFIDDARYAANYQRLHASRGNLRIKFELIKKGVSDDVIGRLHSTDDREAQLTRAIAVAEAWIHRKQPHINDKQKLKMSLMSKLSRQGFEYEIILEVIGKLID